MIKKIMELINIWEMEKCWPGDYLHRIVSQSHFLCGCSGTFTYLVSQLYP